MKLLLKFALWWMQRSDFRPVLVYCMGVWHPRPVSVKCNAEAIHHLDRAIQWLEGQI